VTNVRGRPVVGIVDDDESVRKSLKKIVSAHNCTAEAFASAEELLESDRAFDCLVIDVVLPGMNGLRLQDRLAETHRRVPIVFISANDDEGLRTRALAAGASSFLLKPFGKSTLLEAIDAALKS
jgi:FixJ family two-component response regulator